MKIVMYIIFFLTIFGIFWAMIGYNLSLKIIYRFFHKPVIKNTVDKPSVTVMIVAHNEQDIIHQKLENVTDNDYPIEKITYLVTSDNSTDRTNQIVTEYISSNPDKHIKLHITKEHKGKTNAQNEGQVLVDSDILIMTDANSMFKKNAISELVSSFSAEDIAYVCGSLIYYSTNNSTAEAESKYWNGELQTRLIESNIKTITAGNGAIYACRNSEYIVFPPIESHDASMPYYYGMHNKRALFNDKAIAYEKAGESTQDEYNRKVRMNRGLFLNIKRGLKAFNIFKHGWFSFFYFGHRTTRYLLWINHFLVLLSSLILAIIDGWVWIMCVIVQLIFFAAAFIGRNTDNKLLYMIHYYCITVFAQWNGVFNIITGKTKPTWECAKSTRE